MSDDALREVLRSPLDDLPPPRRGTWAGAAALLLAVAAGFGVVAGIRALGNDSPAIGETTTTTQSATSTTAAGPVALGGLGVEAVAAWNRGDRLYLVVATTVPPGADPSETEGLSSAHWVLRAGEGDLLTATAELSTPLAAGLFTLEFPATDLSAGAELLVYPAVEVVDDTFSTALDSAQFPWEGPLEGTPYRLAGEELAIDRIRLDDGGGEIVWHLAGDSESRATVSAGATYSEVEVGPQAVVAERDLPEAYLVAAAGGAPATRSGAVHLFHIDNVYAPSYRSRFFGDPTRQVPVEQLNLEIVVRMYHYAADPVVVPVDLVVTGEG
jgi:hypothetical protein